MGFLGKKGNCGADAGYRTPPKELKFYDGLRKNCSRNRTKGIYSVFVFGGDERGIRQNIIEWNTMDS